MKNRTSSTRTQARTNRAIYYETQVEALDAAISQVPAKFEIHQGPTEHVNYETYVKYAWDLTIRETGMPTKKCLIITLYRMPSGRYELTNYIN
jgi:hypothetical protein